MSSYFLNFRTNTINLNLFNQLTFDRLFSLFLSLFIIAFSINCDIAFGIKDDKSEFRMIYAQTRFDQGIEDIVKQEQHEFELMSSLLTVAVKVELFIINIRVIITFSLLHYFKLYNLTGKSIERKVNSNFEVNLTNFINSIKAKLSILCCES